MRRAILFVAWGDPFVQEVLDCIASSELPAYPLYLLTDEQTSVPEGAPLEVLRASFELHGKLRKAELIDHLPADVDTWMFLDSDTRVLGDLSLGFDQAERHGLALALAPHCTLESFKGFGEVLDAEGLERAGQAQFNTGVVFFHRRDEVDEVLRLWHELCLRHRERSHSDQPYFSVALEQLGVRPYVLSAAFNYRGIGEWVGGTLRVWHTRDPLPAGPNADEGMRRLREGEVLRPEGLHLSPVGWLRLVAAGELVLAAMLLAALASRGQPLWAWLHAPVVVLLALLLTAQRALRVRRWLQRATLVGAVLGALVVLPELGLRVAGYERTAGVSIGPPRAVRFARFVAHDQLLWTRDPADHDVNSLGLPVPEPPAAPAEDARRVLFLGDSCTAQGFPERVEGLLPGNESVVLACQGYSSLQGLRLAQLHGVDLEPDVVVVAFGWNDHWRARGAVDSERRAPGAGARLVQRSRLLQLLISAFLSGPELLDVPRVSPEAFGGNLAALRALFPRAAVVFVTLPGGHRSLGVPTYLVEEGFAPDEEAVVQQHAAYNQIVRTVAGEQGLLLDLAGHFEDLEAADLERLFRPDGIHFTDAGLDHVASVVARFLDEQVPVAD